MIVDLNEVREGALWYLFNHLNLEDHKPALPVPYAGVTSYGWVRQVVEDIREWNWHTVTEDKVHTVHFRKKRDPEFYPYVVKQKSVELTWWHIARGALSAEYQTDYPDLPDELCKALFI